MIRPCTPIRSLCILATLLPGTADSGEPAYVFSYFHGNGEDGLHLAYSRDGYGWRPLKDDQSLLAPTVGSNLMRDPCIVQGPDATFHLVFTTGWWDKGFGYASSKDLVHWSEQIYVPINQKTKGAKNTWAPELFYDRANDRFLIVFSTTIPGAFPETDHQSDHNHRMYYTATKDFKAFTPGKLLYDPGFNCIDGTIVETDGQYTLVFKDERLGKKCLKTATAQHAAGPYGPPSPPITGDWVEGPSVFRLENRWIVYYDHYTRPQYYGAVTSTDLKNWQPIEKKLSFPADVRHGTLFTVSQEILGRLLDAK